MESFSTIHGEFPPPAPTGPGLLQTTISDIAAGSSATESSENASSVRLRILRAPPASSFSLMWDHRKSEFTIASPIVVEGRKRIDVEVPTSIDRGTYVCVVYGTRGNLKAKIVESKGAANVGDASLVVPLFTYEGDDSPVCQYHVGVITVPDDPTTGPSFRAEVNDNGTVDLFDPVVIVSEDRSEIVPAGATGLTDGTWYCNITRKPGFSGEFQYEAEIAQFSGSDVYLKVPICDISSKGGALRITQYHVGAIVIGEGRKADGESIGYVPDGVSEDFGAFELASFSSDEKDGAQGLVQSMYVMVPDKDGNEQRYEVQAEDRSLFFVTRVDGKLKYVPFSGSKDRDPDEPEPEDPCEPHPGDRVEGGVEDLGPHSDVGGVPPDDGFDPHFEDPCAKNEAESGARTLRSCNCR